MKKTFYRLAQQKTENGFWYNYDGEKVNIIESVYNNLKCSELFMDFDSEMVGYLAATDSLDNLFIWFSEKEIIELQKNGWCIYVYETDIYKKHSRQNHYLIEKNKNNIIKIIEI